MNINQYEYEKASSKLDLIKKNKPIPFYKKTKKTTASDERLFYKIHFPYKRFFIEREFSPLTVEWYQYHEEVPTTVQNTSLYMNGLFLQQASPLY